MSRNGLVERNETTGEETLVTQHEAELDLRRNAPEPLNEKSVGGKGILVKAKNREAGRHYVELRRQSDDSVFRYEPERFIVGQPEKTVPVKDNTQVHSVPVAEPPVKKEMRTRTKPDISDEPDAPERDTRERASVNKTTPMSGTSDRQRQSALQFEPPKKEPALSHRKKPQVEYAAKPENKETALSPENTQTADASFPDNALESDKPKPDAPGNYHHGNDSIVQHDRESLLHHRKAKLEDSEPGSPKEVKGEAFGVSSLPRSDDVANEERADNRQLKEETKPGESAAVNKKRRTRDKLRFSQKEQPQAKTDAKPGEPTHPTIPAGKHDEAEKGKLDSRKSGSGAPSRSDKRDGDKEKKSCSEREPGKLDGSPKAEPKDKKPDRLQFSEDGSAPSEPKNRKLDKAEKQYERTSKKLGKARDDLPSKRRLHTRQVFNTETGKTKTSLAFEKEPISQKEHLKGPKTLRPVKAGANALIVYAHGKVHQVERENAGVEAGHKTEMLVESGLRRAYHQHKTEPYRTVSKLEHDMAKKSANLAYQQTTAQNPQLQGNTVQKAMQKHKIKREYAKKVREAEKAAKRAKKAAEKTAETTKTVAGVVRRHPIATLILVIVLLLLLCVLSMCGTSMSLGTGGMGGIVATTYLADDADMYAAENAYAGLEAELQYEIDHYESLHQGYDEYNYNLDEIWHDPYVLISILSAMYEGEWMLADVQGTLSMLYSQQYTLTQTVDIEIRYRTETHYGSYSDPDTGESFSYSYEVEVPYNYYICNVSLENFNLSHLPIYIMGEEQLSRYALYMAALGNRPDLFPVYAYPHASVVKEPLRYDIPPEYFGDEMFAAIIAEAEKYIGMPYVWGGYNPSTSFDCSGFVSWVINHTGWNVGRLGAQGLCDICTPVLPVNARPGDLIFFVGTYDTPGVSHVGIYVGDNMMLHCGDPIGYASVNTAYWQSHFYTFGRLPGL